MLKYNIALKIKKIRKEKKITQKGIADFLGCESTFISKVERGTSFYNFDHVEKICNALNYPVHFLFVEDEKPQEAGLGEDIKELVNEYRALTPDHQNQIREMVKAFKLTEEMGWGKIKKNSGSAA